VTAYTRDTTTGALTLAGHTDYAWAKYGAAIAVAPDGQTVYAAVTSHEGYTVALITLRRDPLTNALAPLAETALGTGDAQDLGGLVVTPDGSQVVVAYGDGSGEEEFFPTQLAVFPRAPDGTLGLPAVPKTRLLLSSGANLAITPDGRLLLTGSGFDFVLTVDNRDPATGVVRPGQCLAADGTAGCTKAHFHDAPASVAISPDGRFAYTTAGPIYTFAIS
jgi:hypothetical protein